MPSSILPQGSPWILWNSHQSPWCLRIPGLQRSSKSNGPTRPKGHGKPINSDIDKGLEKATVESTWTLCFTRELLLCCVSKARQNLLRKKQPPLKVSKADFFQLTCVSLLILTAEDSNFLNIWTDVNQNWPQQPFATVSTTSLSPGSDWNVTVRLLEASIQGLKANVEYYSKNESCPVGTLRLLWRQLWYITVFLEQEPSKIVGPMWKRW